MKFGEKFQSLRQGAGLSQPTSAEHVGLFVGTVRDHEQGEWFLSWTVIIRIAHALKVTVDEFSRCDEEVIDTEELPKDEKEEKKSTPQPKKPEK